MSNCWMNKIEQRSPEELAEDYLNSYFFASKIVFPINPFQMLNDEGILFKFSKFTELEGVYIPKEDEYDAPLVGINIDRPITRQRFTAAHELCHHIKDANHQHECTSENGTDIERFADCFAAALLMPMPELIKIVEPLKDEKGVISFDDILFIADYFGVSFESCLLRLAYKVQVIDGDTRYDTLVNKIKDYSPNVQRELYNLSYRRLYEDLIDSYSIQLTIDNGEHAKLVFQNNYIYNDSRMEGLEISIERASEIVTDLRLNKQLCTYALNENSEAYMSVAGHYDMYQNIFQRKELDVSTSSLIKLHELLYSHYPFPDFGGKYRESNVLVLGGKFETAEYYDIENKMSEIDNEIIECQKEKDDISLSEYIERVVSIHYKLTRIHPFQDGNGRVLRAFLNLMLINANVSPVYIKVENKDDYYNALSYADKTGNLDKLYELLFKLIIHCSVELSE